MRWYSACTPIVGIYLHEYFISVFILAKKGCSCSCPEHKIPVAN